MNLKIFINSMKAWIFYLFSFKLVLSVIFIIGLISGFLYAYLKPITYTSKIVFVVDEGKSSSGNLGGLASIAGQFGFDVSGGSAAGVLNGDNILTFLRSKNIAREVLSSIYNDSSSFADEYARIYDLQMVWEEKLKQKINFRQINKMSSNRIYDSLLNNITESILEENFSVTKIDKKASFIEISVTMAEENFAKNYSERILNIVAQYYKKTKTERQRAIVDLLQKRSDSLLSLLEIKSSLSAKLNTNNNTMDINPVFKTNLNISSEKTSRDKAILLGIFTEVTKNLELAKFTLSQETPIIQIVDSPLLPLKKNKLSKLKTGIAFGFLFTTLCLIFIIIQRIYKENN